MITTKEKLIQYLANGNSVKYLHFWGIRKRWRVLIKAV